MALSTAGEMKIARRMLTLALTVGLSAQCRESESEATSQALPVTAPGEESNPRLLIDETTEIVEFLRGSGTLDAGLLADSVSFWVPAEGGGAVRVVKGNDLLTRSEWWVGEYTLVPPSSLTELTLHPGSHMNCREMSLGTRFPDIDSLPHVGVRLALSGAASCLQTWNVTLVFRDQEGQAKLMGVAYDQWEW